MGYKVDSLQLELTVTAKQTASSLSKVANALAKIKKETKDMSALVNLRKELNKFSKVNLTPIADALNTIASSSVKAREKLSNMLAEVDKKAKLDVAFEPIGNAEFLGSFTNDLQEASNNTEAFARTVNASAEGVVDAFEPIGNAEFIESFNKEIKGATEEMMNFEAAGNLEFLRSFETSMDTASDAASRISGAEKDADDAAKRFKETLKEQGGEQARIIKLTEKESSELKTTNKELDKTGKTGKKSMLGLEKSIGGAHKALKRFAKYAGYRAIRTSFNAITTSFSEGLKAAYMWSAEAENGFSVIADTMDSINTSTVQVRNQLGSVAGEVLTAIAPAVNAILDVINTVSDALSRFIAAMNGRDTYMRAKRVDTAWQDTSEDIKDATDKVKDFKKELIGIDELNVLGEDKEGAKKEAAKVDVPENMYELADVGESWVLDIAATLGKIVFKWDNLEASDIGSKICTALTAAAGGIIGFSLGGVKGAIIGTIAGIALSAVFSSILFDEKKLKFAPKTAKEDIVNTIFGSAAAAAAGFVIGGPLGAAVGLLVGAGITLAINSLVDTIEEKAMEQYLDSDFKEKLDNFEKEKVAPLLKYVESLSLKIDKITVDLSSDKVKELETVKRLVEDIYTLDEKPNKTSDEFATLKTKVDILNSSLQEMGISDLSIEFDELRGKIITSKDAVLEHLDALIQHTKIEAGMEKYKELLQAAYDADAKLSEAQDTLAESESYLAEAYYGYIDAGEKKKKLEEELAAAEATLDAEYVNFRGTVVILSKSGKELQERIKVLRKEIEKATIDELAQNDALEDARAKYKDVKGAVKGLIDEKNKAKKKANAILDLINDEKKGFEGLTQKIKDAVKALGEYNKATGETSRGFDVDYAKGSGMSDAALIATQKGLKSAVTDSIGRDEELQTEYLKEIADNSGLPSYARSSSGGGGHFAGGGFPEGGHLFFANENGNPEYIGNMGGRTAVANSDQMSAAIEEASFRGMARALTQYGNKNNNNSDWQPMSAQDMYLLLKRTSNNESRRTGNVNLA